MCCRSPSDEHISDLLRAMIAAEPPADPGGTPFLQAASPASNCAASEVCAPASATSVKRCSDYRSFLGAVHEVMVPLLCN